MKNKVPLKQDGTVDVEKIDNMPSDEYLHVLEAMTQEQYQYYSDNSPANKGNNGPSKAIPVNYTLEEALEKGWLVDANKHIQELRDKYLKKV